MAASDHMLAVRWHARGDVRLESVPLPRPAHGEALVEVEACGLCGTDLDEVRHGPLEVPVLQPHRLTGRRAPLVLGHEVVGRLADLGPGTSGPPIGSRVIPDVVLGCGHCWWCRRHQEGLCERHAVRGLHTDGGLAQFMIADAATLVLVDEGLPTHVAVLAEPMSVAVRALRKAGDLTGTTVVVYGIGTVGYLVCLLALRAGAKTIAIDPSADRRALAGVAGALPGGPGQELELAVAQGSRGADVVVECSGVASAASRAIALTRAGGTTVLVGIGPAEVSLSHADVVIAEKAIRGSAAHLWDEDVTAAVRLLEAGVAEDGVPTTLVGLGEAVQALTQPAGSPHKLVVTPNAARHRMT